MMNDNIIPFPGAESSSSATIINDYSYNNYYDISFSFSLDDDDVIPIPDAGTFSPSFLVGPSLDLDAVLLEIRAYAQSNPDVMPFITKYLKRFYKNL